MSRFGVNGDVLREEDVADGAAVADDVSVESEGAAEDLLEEEVVGARWDAVDRVVAAHHRASAGVDHTCLVITQHETDQSVSRICSCSMCRSETSRGDISLVILFDEMRIVSRTFQAGK
jgi:CRISPR/Cas system-associated protein Csm6